MSNGDFARAALLPAIVAASWPRRVVGALKLLSAAAIAAFVCGAQPAIAQFGQQGAKLVGSGYVAVSPDAVSQGYSVAVSADGNTMIEGGPGDNGGVGAAWVFTRSNGVWTQQGAKLVGNPEVYEGDGASVALSADGNTALVGAPYANSSIGGAWVFTRSNGAWTAQAILLGSGNSGNSLQGLSVALSADGNTAVVGGPDDNGNAGAAWVFTRSNGFWTQQAKFTPSDETGTGAFGQTVALSGDGATAVIGAPFDNSAIGAVWVFTRSGSTWTQQGSKIVGNGAVNSPFSAKQGASVAISADGNTMIEGGPGDNGGVGAAWVFTRSGGVWTQQGNKLTANDESGAGFFGAVALSSDGNSAAIGGYGDNNDVGGATWVFSRSNGAWSQQGAKLVGSGAASDPRQGNALALSADGTALIVGGESDNLGIGAVWVFVRGFSASPTAGTAPLNVVFTLKPFALGSNTFAAGASYGVNFGDGASGTLKPGAMPMYSCAVHQTQCVKPTVSLTTSHTYTSGGLYTAALMDASGDALGTAMITVSNSDATCCSWRKVSVPTVAGPLAGGAVLESSSRQGPRAR